MLINVHKIYTGTLSLQAQYSRLCPISSSFRCSGNLSLSPSPVLKVKVTLRLTVSQTVSLGVESHLGLMNRYTYLLLFDSYGLVFYGAPSLTRGRVCLLYM
jgi:hypothetical protein